jgi:hypothetical protein
MIQNLTSVGKMISKIYRDLRLSDPQFELDAIEWVGEAVAHIGTGVTFQTRTLSSTVVDYRVEMPSDLFRLQEVFLRDAQGNLRPISDSHGSRIPDSELGIESYVRQGRYLHFTFETGEVELVYDGIAVDEEGYPLIPDDPEFTNAFLWYIMRQMMVGGWEHPNRQITFEKADEMWQRYCRQARVKSQIPSISEYENFYQNWVHMVPMVNRRESHFSSTKSNAIYGRVFYRNEL